MAPTQRYTDETGFLRRVDQRGNKVVEIGFKLADRNYDFAESIRHNIPMSTEVHVVAFLPFEKAGDRLLVNNVPSGQGRNLIKRLKLDFEGYQQGADWEGEYTHRMRGSTYELRRIS